MSASELTDIATLLTVNEEVLADPKKPTIKQLDPLNQIEVELALLEADNMVEVYFEQYRNRFIDPTFFDTLREGYRRKYREHILKMVDWARSLVKGTDMKTELKRTLEERLTDDGWEVECESPLELRNINGAFVTGDLAREVLDRYKRGLDGKQ